MRAPSPDRPRCPACTGAVTEADHFCGRCGAALPPPMAVLTPDAVARAGERLPEARPPLLPALRVDLAPLVPPLRRAAASLAAAVVVDWALRSGARAVLSEGRSALGRSLLGQPSRRRAATQRLAEHRSPGGVNGDACVVIEQRITVRR